MKADEIFKSQWARTEPAKPRSVQRLVRRSRFRWQHCTECGHEGIGLAVLHLQDCFPCPICKHSTVRRYGAPNEKTVPTEGGEIKP